MLVFFAIVATLVFQLGLCGFCYIKQTRLA